MSLQEIEITEDWNIIYRGEEGALGDYKVSRVTEKGNRELIDTFQTKLEAMVFARAYVRIKRLEGDDDNETR